MYNNQKMSYSDVQTFKSRFWKHVWELDPESLRDLLKEGNPVGHVDFKFRVPSHHGYDFIPAYEGMYSACSKTHKGQNKAIDNYLGCHDKTAVEILWSMLLRLERDDGTLVLPSGARINDDYTVVTETLVALWRNGATNVSGLSYVWHDDGVLVRVKDLYGVVLINIWGHPDKEQEQLMEEFFERSCTAQPEHYQLMLLLHPRHFNRFLNTFPLYDMDDLFDWCKADTDVTEKLWKLRLVKLDPKRWPTVDDLDDISVEELKAMYEGHPLVVVLEQDEPPAKKRKI